MSSIRLSLLFVADLLEKHVSNTRSQEGSVAGEDTIRVISLKIRTHKRTNTSLFDSVALT